MLEANRPTDELHDVYLQARGPGSTARHEGVVTTTPSQTPG
jgi:hypothetical protein